MKIKSQEDFWAGVMFISFGLIAIFIARDYPFGTARNMGPGYFPTWIGIVMVCLGVAIAATGFKNESEGIGNWAWKPIVLLSIAFVIFGWAIDNIGFVPALFVMVMLASAAGRDYRFRETIIVSIFLIIGSWALFIKGLKLPFRLFW